MAQVESTPDLDALLARAARRCERLDVPLILTTYEREPSVDLAHLLGALKESAAVPLLVAHLNRTRARESSWRVAELIRVLASLGGDDAREAVYTYDPQGEEGSGISQARIDALLAMEDPRGVDELCAWVGSEWARKRFDSLPGPVREGALVRGSNSIAFIGLLDSDDVGYWAQRHLDRVAPDVSRMSASELTAALRHPVPFVRQKAANRIGTTADDAVVDTLCELLEDPFCLTRVRSSRFEPVERDYVVRQAAAATLRRIGGQKALDALARDETKMAKEREEEWEAARWRSDAFWDR